MKIIFALVLLTNTIYTTTAWAQCTTGLDTGGQCIPPDALERPADTNQHPQPQQSLVRWSTRWGAIAIDDSTGEAGTVVNYINKSEAVNAAMHDCAMHGSQHCKVGLAYYNQCAAIAWGTKFYDISGGPTKHNAESVAVQRCSKEAPDCKIVYSACSFPVRIQ